VIAGHISGVFSAASTAMGLAKEGKAHVLGVTGTARSPALPDVPTFAEKGVRMTGFKTGSWYGLVAPAGTPDDIIAKLNVALREAAGDKDMRERLARSGLELTATSPQEFKDFLAGQYRYWGESLRAAGIKPGDR
jgi:tripartite-type tricarboxylate transporter receptor subunit TctC